ncbi:hypothetical protein [Streptomyces sp. NPDC051310]|uniref:hypothetical protein n=1 Tax=Streptomyces sp. NPDC051310 TaxID=3365649 RepID=UPI0037BA9EB0
MAEKKPSAAVRPRPRVPASATRAGVTHIREHQPERYTVIGNHLAQLLVDLRRTDDRLTLSGRDVRRHGRRGGPAPPVPDVRHMRPGVPLPGAGTLP